MMLRMPGGARTALALPAATALFAAAVFVADALTPVHIIFSVLYSVVVLSAGRFCSAHGVIAIATGCVLLTFSGSILSIVVSGPGELAAGIVNTFIAALAVILTAVLVLRAEAAARILRESEFWIRQTLNSLGVAIWSVNGSIHRHATEGQRSAEPVRDPHGLQRALDWTPASIRMNPASLRIFEAGSQDEIIAALDRIFPPQSLDTLLRGIAHALEQGSFQSEVTARGLGGAELNLLLTITAVSDSRRGPRALLTITDLTERRRAERALQEAEATLAHSNRLLLLGEMAASLAHEVTQPISGAIANANAARRWLKMQPPNYDEASEALDRIVRDGNRAASVIERVRRLVNKQPPRREPLDVNDAILEVIALADQQLRLARVVPETRLALDLPLASADRVQVQQVILNLVSNAIEAMAEEETRSLTILSARQGPDEILLEVRDAGPGFDPAALDRLFDAFYSTKPGGMGMGLAICRSIVEAHGGRLWAAANQPRGAIFRLTLPTASGNQTGALPQS